MSFSIKKRAVSFTYAISGIKTLIITQHNAWIHLFATFTVISAGFLFKLTGIEWAIIIFAIILVWMAEALNTAIEFLADSITKDQHPLRYCSWQCSRYSYRCCYSRNNCILAVCYRYDKVN